MDKEKLNISASQIKKIRSALGCTQEEFAGLLGVGKVTVARWESGARSCKGKFAELVLRKTSNSRTTPIFSLRTSDLVGLSSSESVDVFRRLLHCECRRCQISGSQVSISDYEIPDGGIDAYVPPSPIPDSFLSGCHNFFQIKAGGSFKPWQESCIKGEMLDSDGLLKSEIKQCLQSDGRYTLVVFGHDLTPEQRRKSKENIGIVLKGQGYLEAHFDTWGAGELISELSRFPFLSNQLMGRQDYPFSTWDTWGRLAGFSNQLELGDKQLALIGEIRRLLEDENVRHIRLVGEPGLGKTHLVYEALSQKNFSGLVVYIEHAEDFQGSRLYHDMLNPDSDYYVILVVDECTPRECYEIWKGLKGVGARVKVVSIDHVSCDISDGSFVELECSSLAVEQIENIIKSHSAVGLNLRRWAELCSGVPRVAHALGEYLKVNPGDLIKRPTISQLWNRFVLGYDKSSNTDEDKLIVLRYLSIFQKFGYEEPVENEAEFIARLLERDHGISKARFSELVYELKKQKILQGKTTLFIVPKLLHIHLWVEYWERHGKFNSIQGLIINDEMPESLAKWYARMFTYAGESACASQQAARLLGVEGPFSNAEFAFSDIGRIFLGELTEATPDLCISCLERLILKQYQNQVLSANYAQHSFVWSLKRLAMRPHLFEPSVELLLRIAEMEGGGVNSHSVEAIADLFSLAPGYRAPTGAAPSVRLPLLKRLLQSENQLWRSIGMKACNSAVDFWHKPIPVGQNFSGLSEIDLWSPETWVEVYDAMFEVWNLFYGCSRTWEELERGEANLQMVEHAKILLCVLSDQVLAILKNISEDDATDKKELARKIRFFLKYPGEDYSEQVLDGLRDIERGLYKDNVSDRLLKLLDTYDWDDYDSEEAGDVLSATIQQIVKQLVIQRDELEDAVSVLVKSDSHVAFNIGREFFIHDQGGSLELIIRESKCGNATAYFLSGYLSEKSKVEERECDGVILNLLRDNDYKNLILPVIRNVGCASDEVFLEIINMYESSSLEFGHIRSLRYSNVLDKLSDELLVRLIRLCINDGQFSFVAELLIYIYANEKCPERKLPKELAVDALLSYDPSVDRERMASYNWAKLAEELIRQYPDEEGRVFDVALHNIVKSRWFVYGDNNISLLMGRIIKSDEGKCWSRIERHLDCLDERSRRRIFGWLGPDFTFGSDNDISMMPLTFFEKKRVFDWVDIAPEERSLELLDALPRSLVHEEGQKWVGEFLSRYGAYERVTRYMIRHFMSSGWRGKASNHYRDKRKEAREWLAKEKSSNVRRCLEAFIDNLTLDIKDAEFREEREFLPE